MPKVDQMGQTNDKHGVCGITSTLYAVYLNRPALKKHLANATAGSDTERDTRIMAEIKTFLVMLKAAGSDHILAGIQTLTRSFPAYSAWTIDKYIADCNKLTVGKLSIAMPPEAVIAYMSMMWDLRPVLVPDERPGAVILGLTRTGAPVNQWNNLAHFVYQHDDGRIYSWGSQFTDLADVNQKRGLDYSVVHRIMVHG